MQPFESNFYCFVSPENFKPIKSSKKLECIEQEIHENERKVKEETKEHKLIKEIIEEDPSVSPSISLSRVEIFSQLGPICKQLLLLIYGNYENFIKSLPHPLEEVIIMLDKHWENERTVRAIASRIGIYVGLDLFFNAAELFVDKLVDVIQYVPEEDLEKIMNMREKDFQEWRSKYGIQDFFQDRLYNYAKWFMSNEIK